jgi:hypothetical protein
MEDAKYKLSTFGLATVSAMKGVEEAPEIEPKRRLKLALKWKAVFAALMIAVVVLSGTSALQMYSLNQLSASQAFLSAQNQQMLSWGMGTNKIADLLHNVAQIDTNKYKISLLTNDISYRNDLSLTEENFRYSLTSIESNLDVNFRFRANHISRYEMHMVESSPLFDQPQPSDLLETAKGILTRYKNYTGDIYLDEMSNLLTKINQTQAAEIVEGNMKLQITVTDGTTEFLWMYTAKDKSGNDVDFNAKSLRMTFDRNVLTSMIDGYFLFTIDNTNVVISKDKAVEIAQNYARTHTWTIDGKDITGLSTLDTPESVQFVPHPRGNSVALVPYWYVILRLDRFYSGGVNAVTIGLYADSGEIVDVQTLSSS